MEVISHSLHLVGGTQESPPDKERIINIIDTSMNAFIRIPHETSGHIGEEAYEYELDFKCTGSGKTTQRLIPTSERQAEGIGDKLREYLLSTGTPFHCHLTVETETGDSWTRRFGNAQTGLNVAIAGEQSKVEEALELLGTTKPTTDFNDQKIAHFYHTGTPFKETMDKLSSINALKWFVGSGSERKASEQQFPKEVQRWQDKKYTTSFRR